MKLPGSKNLRKISIKFAIGTINFEKNFTITEPNLIQSNSFRDEFAPALFILGKQKFFL